MKDTPSKLSDRRRKEVVQASTKIIHDSMRLYLPNMDDDQHKRIVSVALTNDAMKKQRTAKKNLKARFNPSSIDTKRIREMRANTFEAFLPDLQALSQIERRTFIAAIVDHMTRDNASVVLGFRPTRHEWGNGRRHAKYPGKFKPVQVKAYRRCRLS